MTSVATAEDTLIFEPSTPIREWAVSTTAAWTKEVKTEMRLQRRRACIARCREKTKSKLQQMRRERNWLEQEVKQYLAALSDDTNRDGEANASNTRSELCRLAHESDTLRREAASLRKKLQQFDRFYSLVRTDALIVGLLHEDPSHHLTVREASKTSKWVLSPNSGEFGWQVCFPSGEPSFYFHPFTRAEFEDILQLCDETLAADPPHIEVAGSLLGWTVHRASLTRRVEDGSIISHARFTMRVACSLEELDSVIISSSLDSWPLIWTPPSWGYKERKQVCCQVLQEFETDAYVLVHDIPGPIRSRYISLARRLPRQDSGKRSITYVMVIADSEAKSKKCTTDEENGNVKWINEGGSYIKFTEVNSNLIDVRYDRWASCQDELHAQHLFVRWAEFANEWAQRMVHWKLLRFNHQK
ncbi:hypothetical protein AM588_10001296 [Phytophthora nicotianae]|uniref:Uncharacterized protein n=1 Tax=Phytophthora nicotianae TaxID=4792 RepID=A0A0W8CHI6_PHYNI|nr:hypothetical protein AM588_10001296 [Phytophthora nicotianae]